MRYTHVTELTEAKLKKLERDALYRARNADKIKARVAANKKRWKSLSPERRAEYARKGAFGLESKDFQALLASQDGLCAICRKPETTVSNGKVRALSVDHDHATGRIRGLLCQRCNLAIGNLDDSPDRARAVAHYLEESSK